MDDIPVEVRARAARDRNLLASLVARGKVWLRRDQVKPEYEGFVADIERRARAQRAPSTQAGVNLAIRPKKKKRRTR